MKKREVKRDRAIRSLRKNLATSGPAGEDQLDKSIEQLESFLATLKHDLHSREGLYQTVHPRGVIELACHVHLLATEIKTKQEVIKWLEQVQKL